MSVTRDKNTGKWMSQIRVKDWTGKEIHKKKRGFKTKKEALQWEQDFISQADGSLGMKFKDFVEIYMKDANPRLRETTLANKHYLFNKKVLPYFGEMPINAIKPTDIRNWQNELINYRRPNGRGYSPTYLRTINNQLTAAFNFAVKFYGLRENPCHKAGTMGKKNADEMLFWTNEEFKEFIKAMESRPVGYTVFMVMYYTGLRVGELLALTPEDIDFDRHIISVNKNYQRLNGKDYIYPPKTEAGYREVVMPKVLESCLKDYLAKLYDVQPTDRIFPYDRGWVGRQMKYGCDHSGTQKIRVHDVRHTHASLLIDMGCTPLLVAERLGHEKVQTTMDTYSHLYRLPATGLRFFTVYGPWGRPDMALYLFTKAILAGEPIKVFNEGKMRRDFTYIDDIIEGVMRVMARIPQPDPAWDSAKPNPSTSTAPWRIYNIGNNNTVELGTFISTLEDALGKKAIRNLMPMQPGDVEATWADVSDLIADTGFRPQTSVEYGVGQFVKWYKEYYGA